MHSAAHTELAFETAIEAGLIGAGGYTKRDATAYDPKLALFPTDVIGFLKAGQPAKWDQLEALLGAGTEATVLDSLVKELDLKGDAPPAAARLQVLRQELPSRVLPA